MGPWVTNPMTANTYELRNVASGWQAVEFINCDTDDKGRPVKATAEKVVKRWAPTERKAEKKLRGTGE